VRLLLFCPCEKVIVGHDNSVHAISILQEITVTVEGQPIPSDARIPLRWSFLTIWQREAGDEGVVFRNHFKLLAPGQTDAPAIAETSFQLGTEVRTHRLVSETQGFPVGLPGEHQLLLFWSRDSEPEWREAARFPILVRHTTE
jgi:hypothetical protein